MAKAYKIGLLGCSKVGKTCLIQGFCGQSVEEYFPTIEDTFTVFDIQLESHYYIDLMDTSGDDEFKKVRDHWLRDADSLVLVYSVDSRESFQWLESVKGDLKSLGRMNVPIVVVGNKIDKDRSVDQDEGRAFAESFKNGMFIETSAKENVNVQQLFRHVLKVTKKKMFGDMSKGDKEKLKNPIC